MPGEEDVAGKSSGHLIARQLLVGVFPHDYIAEEVYLPGCGPPLYLDFMIFSKRMAIEVQGEQHRKRIVWFHPTMRDFHEQVRRDDLKSEWARLNDFLLIRLHDNDTENWAAQIETARRT